MLASGFDPKLEKAKVSILLNIIGEGVSYYNILKLTDDEKENDNIIIE